MSKADEIVEVRMLPLGDVRTTVWLSDSAANELTAFVQSNDGKEFAKKLKEIARSGFQFFEPKIVESQGSGVYRVGIKLSLFRMYGFYGSGFKTEFIGIVADYKPGQRRGKRISQRVKEVARVKKFNLWRKVL
jgi:hypothetical protein